MRGKIKEYLQLLIRNHRRTSLHLKLLSRADLGVALSLFSRMLDELDQVHFCCIVRMTLQNVWHNITSTDHLLRSSSRTLGSDAFF